MATDGASKSPAEHITELKDLVVGYARQETWDPIKTLGRYLGYGVGGGLCVGFGCIFILLSLLRCLESLDAFDGAGALSIIPYAATVVLAAGMIALAVQRITKDYRKEPHA